MTKNENTNKSNYVTLTRRVGNTNYKVNIYFSETEKETMEEKMVRLIFFDSIVTEPPTQESRTIDPLHNVFAPGHARRLVENERLRSEDTCGTMETPQMSRQSERSAS